MVYLYQTSPTPVEARFLHAVCPICAYSFVLRGEKLRKWVAAKQKNPDRKGPYCNYKCSSKTNVLNAHAATRGKSKKVTETILSDGLS